MGSEFHPDFANDAYRFHLVQTFLEAVTGAVSEVYYVVGSDSEFVCTCDHFQVHLACRHTRTVLLSLTPNGVYQVLTDRPPTVEELEELEDNPEMTRAWLLQHVTPLVMFT